MPMAFFLAQPSPLLTIPTSTALLPSSSTYSGPPESPWIPEYTVHYRGSVTSCTVYVCSKSTEILITHDFFYKSMEILRFHRYFFMSIDIFPFHWYFHQSIDFHPFLTDSAINQLRFFLFKETVINQEILNFNIYTFQSQLSQLRFSLFTDSFPSQFRVKTDLAGVTASPLYLGKVSILLVFGSRLFVFYKLQLLQINLGQKYVTFI